MHRIGRCHNLLGPHTYSMEAAADTQWREFTLDCPLDATPVEGYRLSITAAEGGVSYWIDTVGFEPQWKAGP